MTAMQQAIATITALPGGYVDTRFFGTIRRRKRVMLLVQVVMRRRWSVLASLRSRLYGDNSWCPTRTACCG